MVNEHHLTVAQAATHLQVTPATVRLWLRQGKLRGHMIGGIRAGYRIPETEVIRLLRGEQQHSIAQ